jgi:hypothetical protein
MSIAAAVLLSMGLLSGCLAPPTFFNPGSENYQQWRAQKFDPYPEPDGAGSMAGMRPPDFENPKPEILRSQPQVQNAPGY